MKAIWNTGFGIAACTAIVLTAPLAAAADAGLPAARHEGSVTYVNGGVGKDEQMAMHRLARRYPLRMAFSERKDGEFLADVPVVITNAHGSTVLALPKAGPMLDVRLPAGKYRVTAQFTGRTEAQDVTLDGKAARNLYFHWKGNANS